MRLGTKVEDGNILGIDRGTKYIGVSYRNSRSGLISPIGSLMNDESLFFNMGDVIQRYRVGEIRIGYPKNHEDIQEAIDGFIQQIAFIDNEIVVKKVDEEYSSVEASATTGNFHKSVEEDTVASMKILENSMKGENN